MPTVEQRKSMELSLGKIFAQQTGPVRLTSFYDQTTVETLSQTEWRDFGSFPVTDDVPDLLGGVRLDPVRAAKFATVLRRSGSTMPAVAKILKVIGLCRGLCVRNVSMPDSNS